MTKKISEKPPAPTKVVKASTYAKQKKALSTNIPSWCCTKAELTAKFPSSHIILSKDVGCKGAKLFTAFDTYHAYITYLSSQRSSPDCHYHEVIPTATGHPVYLAFDIDRNLTPEADGDIIQDPTTHMDLIITRFEAKFSEFLAHIYNIPFTLTLGSNYHVCESTNPSKLSCHVKTNIKLSNMLHAKAVVSNFITYLRSNKYTTPEDSALFNYTKPANGTAYTACIIDKAIYTEFRSMRVLYSRKNKPNGRPLIPYKNSSPNIADHLILFHAEYASHALELPMLHNQEVPITADYQQLNKIHATITRQPILQFGILPSSSPASIPDHILCQVEEELANNQGIKAMLKTRYAIPFKYNKLISPSTFLFYIDKEADCTCPYANRPHTNNRSFFEFDYTRGTATYKCHSEACKEKQAKHSIVIRLNYIADCLQHVSDSAATKTLHCRQNLITWDESYAHETMMPYPIKPITCIRANMGVGKTYNMIPFIQQHCRDPNTKCLFITYNRILSNKYYQAFSDLGFVNYLNQPPGAIREPKVIVCLDSLPRIKTANFHYIIVDEVLSVLLHFNSEYLKHDIVSTLFELFLIQAKHLYFLDAHVDNLLVHQFVSYIAQKRHQKPYWISNAYVKPTNRQAHITINQDGASSDLFKAAVLDQIIILLSQNQRIVVASSTMAFTKLVTARVAEAFKSQKTVMMYNRETENIIKYEHSLNPNGVWSTCDLLLYSPTISAGVSFDPIHFDSLIAFTENSLFTPGIDLALQQLFRVRSLTTGKMLLYVNDCTTPDTNKYPDHPEEISTWLDNQIGETENYFPEKRLQYTASTRISQQTGTIAYDRERLSYHILHGMIYNINKSLHYFTDILVNTLQQDYNIPCNTQYFVPKESFIVRATKLIESWKQQRASEAAPIPFSPELILPSARAYYELKARYDNHESLTNLQKQQKWTWDMAYVMWGIHKDLDQTFYDTFVFDYRPQGRSKALGKLFAIRRLKDYFEYDLATNKQRFKDRMESIVSKQNYNIDLYRTHVKEYYHRLLEAHELLDYIMPAPEQKEALKTNQVVLDTDAMTRLEAYIKTKNQAWLDRIRNGFGMRNNATLEAVTSNPRALSFWFAHVMQEAFEIEVGRVRKPDRKVLKSTTYLLQKTYFDTDRYDDREIEVLID